MSVFDNSVRHIQYPAISIRLRRRDTRAVGAGDEWDIVLRQIHISHFYKKQFRCSEMNTAGWKNKTHSAGKRKYTRRPGCDSPKGHKRSPKGHKSQKPVDFHHYALVEKRWGTKQSPGSMGSSSYFLRDCFNIIVGSNQLTIFSLYNMQLMPSLR